MRYVRIFLLHLQNIFTHRGKSFVWFLIALINPFILILLWQGSDNVTASFSPTMITSYYLTLVIADALLMAHIEEDVATRDIYEGHLTKYLLKPFSYYWFKFCEEIPFRILQATYGVIIWFIFFFFFGNFVHVTTNPFFLLVAGCSIILGFFLAFTFKMFIGLFGFWIRDMQATFQLTDAFILVFAGYIVPLPLMPDAIAHIAETLPFSYMIYYPIVLFEGLLPLDKIVTIVAIQALWLAVMLTLYLLVWQKGLQKYSAVGQ